MSDGLNEKALVHVSLGASGIGLLNFRTIPIKKNYRFTEVPKLLQVTYGTKADVTITIKEKELKDLYAISVEALGVNKEKLEIKTITVIEEGTNNTMPIPIDPDTCIEPGYTRQYYADV